MPRRDGTGPMGRSSTTGRNLGVCNGNGLGLGYRRGSGRNFVADTTVTKTQQELLQEQKKMLESRLDIISKQLQSL